MKIVDCDVVIVGGGIAGSSLASVLAREGLEVVVLERQRRYADRVRGEFLVPWGVVEARRLGLYGAFVAAGAHHTTSMIDYGDGIDPAAVEAEAIRYADFVDGVPGSMAIGHPVACEALATAAGDAGARVERGVTHVKVASGPRPAVAYRVDDVARRVQSRLVVGADGRSSTVRRQAGIELERAAEEHMAAGLLVDDLDVDPARDIVGMGEDVYMITFPQGGGRARLYLCWGLDDRQRFAGRDAIARFLRACAVPSVPDSERWTRATPVGPCRSFPGDDTWTERPFADDVVLLGDAGGYNNPLIGQGLSLALRDVRALSERLLDGREWGGTAFETYGTERAERLRRMRFVAQLEAAVTTTFGPAGRALRQAVAQRLRDEPALAAPLIAELAGPETLPPEVCTDGFRRRYLRLEEERHDAVTAQRPEPTATL